MIDNSGREQVLYINNVYYVPEFNYNLLSLRKGSKLDDLRIEFDEDECQVSYKDQGYTVMAPVSYPLDLHVLLKKEVALMETVSTNAMILGHRRLGHMGITAIKTLYEDYFREGRSLPKS